MVLGIIAVITCYFGIFLGIIAVIFGHLSLSKMKRNPQLSGKGMAIAGLATGYVAIAISVLFGISMMMAGSAGKGFFEEVKKEMKKQEIEQERIRAEEQGRIDAEQKNDQSRERIPDQQ